MDPLHPVIAAGLDAVVECGYRKANDISGGLEVGFGPIDQNIVGGQRLSAANAYLLPALSRLNLDEVVLTAGGIVGPSGDGHFRAGWAVSPGAPLVVELAPR
jgi:hypothetical protein